MEKDYINEFTKDWELLQGNGVVEVWKFFDSVEWASKYAIKINGEVKTSFSESDGNPYTIFEIVSQCF